MYKFTYTNLHIYILNSGIAQLQTNGWKEGRGGGGDMAVAIDEVQFFSNLFRHEDKIFSQVYHVIE